jgi:hypothetical protein
MASAVELEEALKKLDIVCHSMGYAYALGMVEALKGKIAFGRLYVIAPENAGSGTVDINQWQEIWQYGADLGRQDGITPDPDDKQDGIAPQTRCGLLPETHRVYIPDGVTKGFYESHNIENYKWIFTRIPSENGYVKPR